MEITRPYTASYETPSEAVRKSRNEPVAAVGRAQVEREGAGEERPLEQLHEALRSLPEVEQDKVGALRQALREGSLDTSSASLAAGILAYHGNRG